MTSSATASAGSGTGPERGGRDLDLEGARTDEDGGGHRSALPGRASRGRLSRHRARCRGPPA